MHVRDGRIGEERRADEDTIVIGRGGWLHVSEDTLRSAGIGDRAVVRARPGVVELRPAGGAAAPASAPDAPATAMGSLVEVRGVTRRFGREVALERFDATFLPGTLTAVTGPSGSGKSTLLALLAGLDTPDEGEVVMDGVVLSRLDRDARAAFRRERIGVVGQTPGLSGLLSARENVELVLGLRGIDGVEAHERAMDALAIVGLADHAARAVDRLSAGERERVALARAIAGGPGVLVADEPTARLDSVTTLRHRRPPGRPRARARDDGDLRHPRPPARHPRGHGGRAAPVGGRRRLASGRWRARPTPCSSPASAASAA